MEEGDHEPRAAHSERVAERDRTAVHVHALGVESQLPDDGQGLRRERLVQLDQVEIGDLEAGAGEERARELGVEPLGAFVAGAVAGDERA